MIPVNCKGIDTVENSMVLLKKLSRITVWPSNSVCRYRP